MYVITDPGDAAIIFKPHWPVYVAISELLGVRPILVDLPDELTAETMAALPPAKIIMLNDPNNPTRKVFTVAELGHVRDWMRTYNAYAICDECYKKLIYEGDHVSLATLCDWREAGVVTIFSASQSYAMMGWRAGFAVSPASVIRQWKPCKGPSLLLH